RMRVGDRRYRWIVLVADFFPGRGIGNEGTQQLVVELMARLVRVVGANQAVAKQVQVANRVEDLVLDELILVAQAVLVQHPVIVQHHGIVHRAAQGQVCLPQDLDVAHEAEGARAADFLDVRRGGEVDLAVRGALGNDRVVEVDREADLESLERGETGPLVAVFHANRLADADETLGGVLLLDPGRLQQEHEGPRAAVHDRHFGRRQVHIGIVDAQPGHRRKQVLDRGHPRLAVHQRGREPGVADVVLARVDIHRRLEVRTTEYDARIGCCRAQRHIHLVAGMQTDAGGTYDVSQRTLLDHGSGSRGGNTDRRAY